MKKLQLTLIQIDNYGPWTVTPAPRREADLQSLQADLYSSLQREFGARGGLVFLMRMDNMLAISNGISMAQHREIMERINSQFPVTVSMGVGKGSTAYEAQLEATLALQREGSSRGRRSVLTGSQVSPPEEDFVQLCHLDLNHSSLLTDTLPIYDTQLLLQRAHLHLMERMSRWNSLVFYMGGDNFLALCNGLGEGELLAMLADIKRELGLEFKGGVGSGRNGETAARLAAEGLHEIRKGKSAGPIVVKRA
ncbi:MAG: GTP cyclohydrolase IIa [Candidatus Hadarchaeales archaeon]